MPSLRSGCIVTAIYVVIVGIGTACVVGVFAEPANIGGALLQLLPIQILGALFCIVILSRYADWARAAFGPLQWVGLVWFLPAWVVLLLLYWDLSGAITPDVLRGFGAVGLLSLVLVTLCIAFGEEVIFRGILLRSAMTRLAVPVAMLLSAVAFGALHAVNGLLGQDAGDTTLQVVFAVFVGFFLAPVALRVGNLWPLIIWHWLWNVAVILAQVAGVLHPYVLIGVAIQAVVSLWLWAQFTRGMRWR